MEKRDIVQANAITQSRYDFNRIQKNVFYKIIEKVNHSLQEDLFGNLSVEFYKRDFGEITDPDHTREAWNALRELRHKDIDIVEENGNLLNVGFINYAYYEKERNLYRVEVSKMILPYLKQLTKNFTTYNIVVAMSLKSKYSQRFYELGCQYRNAQKPFFIDIESLRQMFCLGNGYKLKSDIKKRVVDVAITELKQAYEDNSCDLWLESWDEGKGNNTRFWFKIHTRTAANNQVTNETMQQDLIAIERMISSIFKKDKNFCKRIMTSLTEEPQKIADVLDKLLEITHKEVKKGENPGALVRYVLREDFNIY